MATRKSRKDLYRKENLKRKPKRPATTGVTLWDFLRGIERTDFHWRVRIDQNLSSRSP